MQIIVTLDDTGRITNSAIVGGLADGQAIDVPDDTDLSILTHARWDGEQLIELPPDPPPESQPDPTARIAELEQQVADLTAAIERGISL